MKIPFLKNFRRGFATNSSSSHSFVYLKEPNPNHDDSGCDMSYSYTEFGWEDFRLDTLKSKLMYWVAGNCDGWDVEAIRSTHDIPELSDSELEQAASGYVDHNSDVIYSTTLDDMRDPRVVVYGGNDNDGFSRKRLLDVDAGIIDNELSTPEWYDDPADREYLW